MHCGYAAPRPRKFVWFLNIYSPWCARVSVKLELEDERMQTQMKHLLLFLSGRCVELELIQTQMAQEPMLRAEVYAHAMRASQNRKKEAIFVSTHLPFAIWACRAPRVRVHGIAFSAT